MSDVHLPVNRAQLWKGSPLSTFVSALRVSYHPAEINFRGEVFTSTQCADHEGPRMQPDFIAGHDVGAWPVADRAQEYNRRLVNSNSTRVGGRHYAPGCLHLNIPDTCWIVDPEERPFVDIVVDIAPPVSSTIERKSVIMVRSILDASLKLRYCHLNQHDVVGSLDAIVEHNSLLRRQVPVGTARQNKGDVGTMHDSNDEAETYIRRCIRNGCHYNDDDDVVMSTARGVESHQEEARTARHCPRVQVRRRQAMRNRLLILDLYRPDNDKECCSKDTNDDI